MNKRIRNKKAKQEDNLYYDTKGVKDFNESMRTFGGTTTIPWYDRKPNIIQNEIEPMTAEQAEEMRKQLKIEFDASGKESASYVSECGWRFQFTKVQSGKS